MNTTTEVVAYRSTKKAALRYIEGFRDELGDTTRWNGHEAVPVHVEWAVQRSETGGWMVVSTVTPR